MKLSSSQDVDSFFCTSVRKCPGDLGCLRPWLTWNLKTALECVHKDLPPSASGELGSKAHITRPTSPLAVYVTKLLNTTEHSGHQKRPLPNCKCKFLHQPHGCWVMSVKKSETLSWQLTRVFKWLSRPHKQEVGLGLTNRKWVWASQTGSGSWALDLLSPRSCFSCPPPSVFPLDSRLSLPHSNSPTRPARCLQICFLVTLSFSLPLSPSWLISDKEDILFIMSEWNAFGGKDTKLLSPSSAFCGDILFVI